MSIITLDGYIAAVKQLLTWMKTGTRTLTSSAPYTVFDIAGQPGAGALNIGNTANGLVPTDAVAGYPVIGSFGGSALGYISRVEFGSSTPCRLYLYDRLFAAGAYAFGADITLASQPLYSSRVPNADYNGLQLWLEAVTAFTGNLSVQIDYLDQDGNSGNTGVIDTDLELPVGRCFQIPLAAGDSGIQKINRVSASVASAGTFNVMVLRPLWAGRVRSINDGDIHDFLKTGLPQIYADSALYVLIAVDGVAVGNPLMTLQVASA
jgi:hypothetical protein